MTTNIKNVMCMVILLTTGLFFASCNNGKNSNDGKDVAEELNDEKFESNKQEKDAQFVVDAAEMNIEEIQMGQLAMQKGSSTHVKELGKMMVDMHTKSQADLSAMANNKFISIPTSPTDDAMESFNKLNTKSGIEFDKAYADMMVEKHKDAIKTFEKASTDCEDTDIKNWAATSLPDLRAHLAYSEECQEKCKMNN